MKYVKLFEEFSDLKETEYGKFFGLDISDVYSITFAWSNAPHFSDYRNENDEVGTAEKRITLGSIINTLFKKNKITKEIFKKISKDNFDIRDSDRSSTNLRRQGDYIERDSREGETSDFSINLKGEDVKRFFYIIENIKEFK